MTNERLVNLINEYMDYVNLTDRLFKENFNIEIPPIIAAKSKKIIPVKGILNYNNKTVKYKFHGLGCCFIFDDNTLNMKKKIF